MTDLPMMMMMINLSSTSLRVRWAVFCNTEIHNTFSQRIAHSRARGRLRGYTTVTRRPNRVFAFAQSGLIARLIVVPQPMGYSPYHPCFVSRHMPTLQHLTSSSIPSQGYNLSHRMASRRVPYLPYPLQVEYFNLRLADRNVSCEFRSQSI